MNTSAKAESKSRNQLRWGSQRHRLLSIYLECGPLSDEDAAYLTDLYKPGCMWWSRCSELRRMGYIRPIVDGTKISSSGNQVMVCMITKRGREELRRSEEAR